MHIALIGADCEENLGLATLAAVADKGGHQATIIPFDRIDDLTRTITRCLAAHPDVIGLGMQFQYRSHEFLHLARELRRSGFTGHLTTGGQFPSLAWRDVLGPTTGIDSVVFYDGEETLADLLDTLAARGSLGEVAGLAIRGPDGPYRTQPRPLIADLDEVPFARRYRPHTRHLGIPFIPIMGSRGCWGRCSYCSITSVYRDAHANAGGRMLRHRSPENVAAEMAWLWHRAGGPCMFCFHDDNLLLPKPAASAARMRALRAALDAHGVGRAALIGKCRPETLTAELAQNLAEMGVIRLYAGVENASAAGSRHLGRGRQHEAVRAALAACREADIFVCYNLLIFEPETQLADIRENIAFIRDHAMHPINFCRAEAYYGTPLYETLARGQTLGGSFMGWNYRMDDERAEVLFRIAAAIFQHRNFAPGGVANRYMGLGYAGKVLDFFYGPTPEIAELRRRAVVVTEGIARDTADHLEAAVDLVENSAIHDRDRVERETARLGLTVAAADRVWHRELDLLYQDMNHYVRSPQPIPVTVPGKPPSRLRNVTCSLVVGLSLAVTGCGSDSDNGAADANVVRPPPPPPPDPPPPPPPPPDPPPPPPIDAGVIDAGTFDAGASNDGGQGDAGSFDAGPFDAGATDATPAASDAGPQARGPGSTRIREQAGSRTSQPRLSQPRLIDQWTDTSPRRAMRTDDLPLHQPPAVSLVITRTPQCIRLRIHGIGPDMSAEWSGDGAIEVQAGEAIWTPGDPSDRLSVAVRGSGGVTMLSAEAGEYSRPAWT